VAVFLLAVLVVVGTLTVVRRENQKCSIDSLVLGEEGMPEGWKKEWSILPPALDTLGAQHAYSIFMQNGDETAHHTVYHYSNEWLAIFHIWFDDEVFFPTVGWDWSELEGANRLSLDADQQQIRCGDSNDPYLGSRCAAVLRYGPYISDFSSSTREGVMSTEDFEQIVLQIDDLFRLCEE
jgi:hypothetical protein